MPEAMEMEQARSPLQGSRASIAASGRSSASRRSSCKSWTLEGIQKAPVEYDDPSVSISMQVVKCTTQFATCMCVVIAVIKVAVYFVTLKAVVRTSALDSCGDLMANCMVLYTGMRMRDIDKKRYPAGQKKFQSIGCLVFSTFMFALMFGNALGNFEELLENEDDVGKAAIGSFFHQTKSLAMAPKTKAEYAAWKPWFDLVDEKGEWVEKDCSGDEEACKQLDGCTWEKGEEGNDGECEDSDKIDNPVKVYYMNDKRDNYATGEVEMAKEMDDKVTRIDVIEQCAEYENEAEMKQDLILSMSFLSVCATYKLGLWLYCILYAIPKSGSNVLVALATDKRNDFICTYSVVLCSTIAFAMKGSMPEGMYDKVDPLVSLLMSFFIMYSWAQLMVEHMQTLSVPAGTEDVAEKVREAVIAAVRDSPCSVSPEDDIKVYFSSENCSAEIYLLVKDGETPYQQVARTIAKLKTKLEALDLERSMITAGMTKKVESAF